MPRISDARSRLMEAARTLIWENSYGSTSVDSICAQAGVQKGSFYHFFTSKSELATAALEADWQAKRAVLDEIFSSTRPPLERLTGYFEHTYRQAGRRPRQMRRGARLRSLQSRLRGQHPGPCHPRQGPGNPRRPGEILSRPPCATPMPKAPSTPRMPA